MNSPITPLPRRSPPRRILRPLTLSAYRLAKDVGVPRTRISKILHDKRGISADTVLHLGKYFGITAECWPNQPNQFDLRKAAHHAGAALAAISPLQQPVVGTRVR